MTKRAPGSFPRRAQNFYPTPYEAVIPLFPHLHRTGVQTYVEPCSGGGDLLNHLSKHGYICCGIGDISHVDDPVDARDWVAEDYDEVDAAITNPPWEAALMAEIMEHQSTFVPGWFLIYSDWLFTKQSARLMWERCTDIVPIGRVRWFPESKSVGYDNCCWVRMDINKKGAVEFWPFPYPQ